MMTDNPYAVLHQHVMDRAGSRLNTPEFFSANIKEWSFLPDSTGHITSIYHKGDPVPHIEETHSSPTLDAIEVVRTYYAIELASLQHTKYIAGFRLYEDMDAHIREVYGVSARNVRNNMDNLQEQLMLQKQQAHQLIQRVLDAMRTDGAITEELLETITDFSERDGGELQKYVTVPEPLAEAGHTIARRIDLDD
jgi:hypothetical protein